MNCHETREYLFAFLDSELDAALSVEVQRHLDRCCRCAREAEIERAIRRRLREVAHGPDAAPDLDEDRLWRALRRRRATSAGRPHPARRTKRRAVAITAAAVLLLACGLAAVLWWVPLPRTQTFAEALIADLEHVAGRGDSLDLASADPADVESWVRATTSWEVNLPRLPGAEAGAKLIGARMCELRGRRIPLVLYEVDGEPVSLVILPADRAALRGMRPMDGRDCYVSELGDRSVVVAPKDGLMYVATGRCPRQRLVQLAALMNGPPDAP